MTRFKKDAYIGDKLLSPESLMMKYGYRPELSVGSIKCPIYQTSTFVFKNAEEGQSFFEMALGVREEAPREKSGLIYSRLNNPDLEILEDRLTLWDGAEACAVFESGMAAISTTLLQFLNPGDLFLHSDPLYGGTEHFLSHFLPRFGVRVAGFPAGSSRAEIETIVRDSGAADRLAMIFIETPSNPTNALVDISMCADLCRQFASPERRRPLLAVDNTFLGPLWQHPLKHGADLVLYSATKYIGGHSDLIAGVCLGFRDLIHEIRHLRSFIGTLAGPWTGWLLLRSLETLKLRMTCQTENARHVADYLRQHPKVERVYYLGHLEEGDPEYAVYKKQCLAPGGIISFDIAGGRQEAFRFLNSLQLFHLAVSLGGTESLAQHPGTMTHSELSAEERDQMGISGSMVRLSIGVENPQDLVIDLEQALAAA